MNNHIQNEEQTVCHQLRIAANRIEKGKGLVADFDYDEEVVADDVMVGSPMQYEEISERVVTLELTFLLPE